MPTNLGIIPRILSLNITEFSNQLLFDQFEGFVFFNIVSSSDGYQIKIPFGIFAAIHEKIRTHQAVYH